MLKPGSSRSNGGAFIDGIEDTCVETHQPRRLWLYSGRQHRPRLPAPSRILHFHVARTSAAMAHHPRTRPLSGTFSPGRWGGCGGRGTSPLRRLVPRTPGAPGRLRPLFSGKPEPGYIISFGDGPLFFKARPQLRSEPIRKSAVRRLPPIVFAGTIAAILSMP